MTDERRLRLISSRYHCKRFSPSQNSDSQEAEFESAQNLSSDFVGWSCALVTTTTSRCATNAGWEHAYFKLGPAVDVEPTCVTAHVWYVKNGYIQELSNSELNISKCKFKFWKRKKLLFGYKKNFIYAKNKFWFFFLQLFNKIENLWSLKITQADKNIHTHSHISYFGPVSIHILR